MIKIDTLIHSRWTIPIDTTNDQKNNTLENHSVAIHNGKILQILPTAQAKNKYLGTETHNLIQHAIMPGIINCHTHAAMTLFRGFADDIPCIEWLNKYIWPAEQKWVNEDFVYTGTQLAIAEMIRGGTTCFNDMYFFPDQVAKAADKSGIRAIIGLIFIDMPTVWAKNTDEYFTKAAIIQEQCQQHPLLHTACAPHAPYTVSDTTLKRIKTLAEKLDIPIHIHLHETNDEIQQSKKQYQKRPIRRLQKLGLLNSRLMAVHMTQLTNPEINLLQKQGVHIIHCPESNLKLASGFCPVGELMRHNINIALGTDGAASNNDLDMFGEMRSAALLAKGIDQNSSTLNAYQVLQMATINGAKALGIEHITGSLKKAKAADLISINLDTIESQPVYDPISQIIYAINRNQVDNVWVAGKQLLKNRQLTTLNTEKILHNTNIWQKKIGNSH